LLFVSLNVHLRMNIGDTLMTNYYNPRKEQRDNLIKNIDNGFKYLLTNPHLDSKIRPDVKKIYEMFRNLVKMVDVEKN